MQGAGDTRIYNNVIRDFEGDGIYLNDRDGAVPGATYEMFFNTFVGYGRNAITIFGSSSVGSR